MGPLVLLVFLGDGGSSFIVGVVDVEVGVSVDADEGKNLFVMFFFFFLDRGADLGCLLSLSIFIILSQTLSHLVRVSRLKKGKRIRKPISCACALSFAFAFLMESTGSTTLPLITTISSSSCPNFPHQPAFLRRVATSAVSRGASSARPGAIGNTGKNSNSVRLVRGLSSPSSPSVAASVSSNITNTAVRAAVQAPEARGLSPAPEKLHGFTLLRQEYISEYNR